MATPRYLPTKFKAPKHLDTAVGIEEGLKGLTEQAQTDVRDFAAQMGPMAGAVFVGVRTVGTATTTIAHGRSSTPTGVLVIPHSDARVWRPAAPDSKYVYLRASSSADVDLWVI